MHKNPLFFQKAHDVKSVKYTGLVSFGHWSELFVILKTQYMREKTNYGHFLHKFNPGNKIMTIVLS